MKKKKIISLTVILFGISLILFGTYANFRLNDNNTKNNNSNQELESIVEFNLTEEEKTTLYWIGSYKDKNGNIIGIIINEYNNYELFMSNGDQKVFIGIDNISNKELTAESNDFYVLLTKNNDTINAKIESKNEHIKMSMSGEFFKNNDDVWSGIYKLDNKKIVIINLDNTEILLNYINNNDIKNQIIRVNGEYLFNDNNIEYSIDNTVFKIKKENDNVTFSYQGDVDFFTNLEGTYAKVK